MRLFSIQSLISIVTAGALLAACGSTHSPASGSGGDETVAEGGSTAPSEGDAAGGKVAPGRKPAHGGETGSAGDTSDEIPSDAGSSTGGGAGVTDTSAGCDVNAVFAKEQNGCSASVCHGKQYQGGVDLLTPGIARRLVGARSTTQACAGQLLIDPKNPDDSLILRLVDAKRFAASPGQCGVMMPYGSSEGLTGSDLSCVESWVRAAAKASIDDMPPEIPFEPIGVESYLAKVKTLMTGGAVTDDELTRVRSDASALGSLLDEWQTKPAFQTKTLDFFRVALEQRLIGTLNFQLDTLEGPHRAQLNANAEESFVRTAWDIAANRLPFNTVVTTRRFAVTTGMLVALAYADNTSTVLRATKHTTYRDPPAGAPAAPWSLSYQVQNKTWLLPQLPATCPKINQTSVDVYDMLMGLVRCPLPTGNLNLTTGTVLSDADFADWHFVDIAPASTQHPAAAFYDVDSLRGASVVYLTQARVGFFTTPAFLGNWDTNDGNQFRVTTSQTLITALGEAISPADSTKPLHTDGLDQAHAPKESSCYGCHQFLDPMRGYFSRQFSTNYQQTSAPTQYQQAFVFHGVTLDGGSLGAFADAIANHPLFATAWVQKLCYYANSESCDAADPEVVRVARVFQDSGFDYFTLVKELFSSPLVTGVAKTQSYTNQDLLVSITRRQHFCQLIDERLGTKDTCKNAGSVVGLIPQDEFSRGSAVPVQPAVTGLFHFAAAEKLCSTIGTKLVTTTGRFKTGAPLASIQDMVYSMMGLSPAHSRSLSTYKQLSQHYDSARVLGASTTDALRDTFTVACMSPDVMGLGL